MDVNQVSAQGRNVWVRKGAVIKQWHALCVYAVIDLCVVSDAYAIIYVINAKTKETVPLDNHFLHF